MGVKELSEKLGRTPTAQDILLYGLLEPRNLLDIVRNFVVFEVEGGRSVRKITRYRQFIAVNEALRRIRTARKARNRGGIVWHTQGSGKSLTMLWLALKLRRDQAQKQPTIVIVTDRTKLDRQITGVFTACGFPNPERADSMRDLRQILEHPIGKTVMTTIQKFQELTDANGAGSRNDVHPTLSEAKNIFVMVDEAHRTQYRSLAANMRKALPNACFLGFTGTPIDRKEPEHPPDVRPVHRHLHDRAGGQGRGYGPHLLRESTPRAAHPRANDRPSIRSRLRGPIGRGTGGDQATLCHRTGDCRRPTPHRGDLPGPHRALHQVHRPERIKGPGGGPRAGTPQSLSRRRWIDCTRLSPLSSCRQAITTKSA